MTFHTTLKDLELLAKQAGMSYVAGGGITDKLRELFSFLPEGTTFRLDGEKVSITIPETKASEKAEASRLAEKAAQRARQGEYGKARDIYRRVSELDPAHPSARRDLAMICVETGDNEEAKDCLIESLRLFPDDAPPPVCRTGSGHGSSRRASRSC